MRQLTRGNIVALVIAGLLLLSGLYFLYHGYAHYHKFFESIDAKPIDIPVDFSRPGTFSGPFHQTCMSAHSESICLEIPIEVRERLVGDEPSESEGFAALRFVCVLTNAEGEMVGEDQFEGRLSGLTRPVEGAIVLMRFVPFKTGEYTLDVEVTQGQPELAGVEQRLIARYDLCGLELLPTYISVVIGSVLILVALVVAQRARKRLRAPREYRD